MISSLQKNAAANLSDKQKNTIGFFEAQTYLKKIFGLII